MGQAEFWIISIIAPAVLLIVLVWLALRTRSSRNDSANRRSEAGTREVYRDEETRRREGTDDL